METMFLVAGLAVAGLVGIAAAFYFSIRSGNRRDKRLRSAGAGRAGAARRPGGRTSTARPGLTRPDLNGHPRRAANGSGPVTTFRPAASPKTYRPKADTGPDPVANFDQMPAGDRRTTAGAAVTRGGSGRPGTQAAAPVAAGRADDRQVPSDDPWPGDTEPASSWPDDSWPDDPIPGDATATDPKLGTAARGASETRPTARMAKPRRRVGFRKGADLDEELWPAESFGGVSDEQFWDDLASDKPLATTARTAQQDPPSKNRLSASAPGSGLIAGATAGLDTGPATGPQAVQAQTDNRKRDERGPGGGRRGTYPAPRTAPDPAAERTAIQPAYAATQPAYSAAQPAHSATQPVQNMKPPLPGGTQPVRAAAAQPRAAAAQPRPAAAQPRPAAAQPRPAAAQPRPASTQTGAASAQPRAAAAQPTETRRRRPSSAEEDPLTSAAFSLRPSGPVDGRSSTRARNGSADRYDTSSRGGTSPYPLAAPTYGDSSSVTQTMSTPPYGQDYGFGSPPAPAAPASEPRRHNGTGSHSRPEGAGTRPVRQPYPRDSHRAAGNQGAAGYPGNVSYPGNGYPANGYQGGGHRANGHRAPYDPRDDYRP
jgi:hypothetical protein